MKRDGIWCSFFASTLSVERRLAIVCFTIGDTKEGEANVLLSFPKSVSASIEAFEQFNAASLFGTLSTEFIGEQLPSDGNSRSRDTSSKTPPSKDTPIRTDNTAEVVAVEAFQALPPGWNAGPEDGDCVFRELKIRFRNLSFTERHLRHPARHVVMGFSFSSAALLHPGVRARPKLSGNPRYYTLAPSGFSLDLTRSDGSPLHPVEEPQHRSDYPETAALGLSLEAPQVLHMVRLHEASASPLRLAEMGR